MKIKYAFVVILVLTGCGGDQFATALALETPDAGEVDSEAPAPDVVPQGTGGAPSTGGAVATGGAPEVDAGRDAAGGSSHSTGGLSQGTGGSSQGTGGSSQTGGAPSTGGVATGGAPATGGAQSTGGTPATGGVTATGGTGPCGGVGLSTHKAATGVTWTDCVPVGTYNEAQAQKACEAWCAINSCTCTIRGACDGVAVVGEGSITAAWVWEGQYVGTVMKVLSTWSSCGVLDGWT